MLVLILINFYWLEGAGKSTLLNYLLGCKMKRVKLQAEGEYVFVVDRGGDVPEVMTIGHNKTVSKTFMPQISEDTEDQTLYVDCPGFLDTRAAVINIANAANIRAAIARAGSVRFVVLISYHSIKADKGRGFMQTIEICRDLFGSDKELKRNIDSVLLGVTHVPMEYGLQTMKYLLTKDTSSEVIKLLAAQLFIYDPTDRPFDEGGGLERAEILARLQKLIKVTKPHRGFKMVLVDRDELTLVKIAKGIKERIMSHLQYGVCDVTDDARCEGSVQKAAAELGKLVRLEIVQHEVVTRSITEVKSEIAQHFQYVPKDFERSCSDDNFVDAFAYREELRGAKASFDLSEKFAFAGPDAAAAQTQQREIIALTFQLKIMTGVFCLLLVIMLLPRKWFHALGKLVRWCCAAAPPAANATGAADDVASSPAAAAAAAAASTAAAAAAATAAAAADESARQHKDDKSCGKDHPKAAGLSSLNLSFDE